MNEEKQFIQKLLDKTEQSLKNAVNRPHVTTEEIKNLKDKRRILMSILGLFKNEDTCVCCGETIPEGRMVCKNCEDKYNDGCNESN